MAPRGRTCVFCRRSASSREHLLPQWLQGVLPADEPGVHSLEIGMVDPSKREWMRRPFREKTRIVCERCNNGWMSTLEMAAQPILTPAIQGTRCLLTADQQRIAATWAFKTCLVYQASQAERPIAPASHFFDLRRFKRPPRQVSIWMGSHYRARQDPANSGYIQRPLALEEPPADPSLDGLMGYLCFLAVGGVSFVVVGHRYRSPAEISYEGFLAKALDQIWPHPSGVLLWPPYLMMDGDFLNTITDRPGGLTIQRPAQPGPPDRLSTSA